MLPQRSASPAQPPLPLRPPQGHHRQFHYSAPHRDPHRRFAAPPQRSPALRQPLKLQSATGDQVLHYCGSQFGLAADQLGVRVARMRPHPRREAVRSFAGLGSQSSAEGAAPPPLLRLAGLAPPHQIDVARQRRRVRAKRTASLQRRARVCQSEGRCSHRRLPRERCDALPQRCFLPVGQRESRVARRVSSRWQRAAVRGVLLAPASRTEDLHGRRQRPPRVQPPSSPYQHHPARGAALARQRRGLSRWHRSPLTDLMSIAELAWRLPRVEDRYESPLQSLRGRAERP